jgi:hypothetical protein
MYPLGVFEHILVDKMMKIMVLYEIQKFLNSRGLWKLKTKQELGLSSLVECPSSMCEALNSIPTKQSR